MRADDGTGRPGQQDSSRVQTPFADHLIIRAREQIGGVGAEEDRDRQNVAGLGSQPTFSGAVGVGVYSPTLLRLSRAEPH